MTILILGIIVFFTVHSVRIFGEGWRTAQVARLGPLGWKAIYAAASLIGFALIAWGFGLARTNPIMLWNPPQWTHHVTTLLTLPAFVLMVAGYVPGNSMKARWGHPMVAGVALWALAHLPANGRVDAVLLFACFFVWAVVDYRAAVRRDRQASVAYPMGSLARDGLVVVIGVIAWALFAFFLHQKLIGQAVLPG